LSLAIRLNPRNDKFSRNTLSLLKQVSVGRGDLFSKSANAFYPILEMGEKPLRSGEELSSATSL
jgi:hypothetical protein